MNATEVISHGCNAVMLTAKVSKVEVMHGITVIYELQSEWEILLEIVFNVQNTSCILNIYEVV